ncbi:Melanophilin [Galemys pyrenaicus]|uniref:Melanophilin n=1 Tax=Galemys pyrenaicus TaxID=202257 RepID=A0A8J5ZYM7_GALPY|nr:Melanophilin [Galemys pyrenaicus]
MGSGPRASSVGPGMAPRRLLRRPRRGAAKAEGGPGAPADVCEAAAWAGPQERSAPQLMVTAVACSEDGLSERPWTAGAEMGGELDLSRLTDEEARHVWEVVQRDIDLRRREEQRLARPPAQVLLSVDAARTARTTLLVLLGLRLRRPGSVASLAARRSRLPGHCTSTQAGSVASARQWVNACRWPLGPRPGAPAPWFWPPRLRCLEGAARREHTHRALLSDSAQLRGTLCARCLQPFRLLGGPRRQCLACGLLACQACSRVRPETAGWLCSPCRAARAVETGSLAWFYGRVRARFGSFGSATVIQSLCGRLQAGGEEGTPGLLRAPEAEGPGTLPCQGGPRAADEGREQCRGQREASGVEQGRGPSRRPCTEFSVARHAASPQEASGGLDGCFTGDGRGERSGDSEHTDEDGALATAARVLPRGNKQRRRLSIRCSDFQADSDDSARACGRPPSPSAGPTATDGLQVSGPARSRADCSDRPRGVAPALAPVPSAQARLQTRGGAAGPGEAGAAGLGMHTDGRAAAARGRARPKRSPGLGSCCSHQSGPMSPSGPSRPGPAPSAPAQPGREEQSRAPPRPILGTAARQRGPWAGAASGPPLRLCARRDCHMQAAGGSRAQ